MRRVVAVAMAAGALLCASTPPAAGSGPRVILASVPAGTSPAQLAAAGLSPGLMSAGLGQVPPATTLRDIGAGNREPPPSDAVPSLLARTTAGAGLTGRFQQVRADARRLRILAGALGDRDLLIAIERPPPPENEALTIGIAGAGFAGNLTSDSTRTDGYVVSTDVAPTVLTRLGIPVPEQMDGEPIRSEGEVDVSAIDDRAERMKAVAERRLSIPALSIAVWILAGVVLALLRPARRRKLAEIVALSIGYLPLTLLATAALEPSETVESLIARLAPVALALLTLRLLRAWNALAVCCGATALAYGADVIAGPPLTTLSLLGPNPVYGARFYGIGNELEAILAVLVPVGVGATLTARGAEPRPAAAAFLITGVTAGLIFGAGAFGADVGATVVLALGGSVAAACLAGGDRRWMLAVLAPLVAFGLLAVIDLISGGDSHLTRSVLQAGGLGDLGDTIERRLRLSAHDFTQSAASPLFWLVAVGLIAAAVRWRAIGARLRTLPALRAAVIGASAALIAGVLVNDSGGTFLALGGISLLAAVTFITAEASDQRVP